MNKECQSWAADVSAHSDGELDQPAASALEAHLSGCADCGRELARARKLKLLLNAAVPSSSADRRAGDRMWARFSEAMPGGAGGSGAATKDRRPARV